MKEVINSIDSFFVDVMNNGGHVYGENYIYHSGRSFVLLISHDMSLTGAPIALEHMAIAIKDLGMHPIVVSPADGKLREDFIKNEIPVVIAPILQDIGILRKWTHLFDIVVVNTMTLGLIVASLNGCDTPVLWWIHESEFMYADPYLSNMPHWLFSNVKVVAVGPRAQAIIKKFRPSYEVTELLYCISDISSETFKTLNLPNIPSERKKFALVGSISEHKGQDILLNAIEITPGSILSGCHFIFVGQNFSTSLYKCIQDEQKNHPELVTHIPSIAYDSMASFYRDVNCVICASRQDIMPIVITEALCMTKPVICSENAGTAQMLEKYDAGIVYHNDSAEELAQCIIKFINASESELQQQCINGRRLYEENFTEAVFKKNIEMLLNQMLKTDVKPDITQGKNADEIADILKKEYERQELRYEKLQSEYMEVVNSQSWKITRPLRNLKSNLTKILK